MAVYGSGDRRSRRLRNRVEGPLLLVDGREVDLATDRAGEAW